MIRTQDRLLRHFSWQKVTASGGPGWAAKYGLDFIEEAPVLVAVLFDPSQNGLGGHFGQAQGAIAAAAACVQNILLAAADMGLGTLWFTFFHPEEMRACLGVPANLEVAGVIPMGRVKGTIKSPPRKQAKVHRESYGRTQQAPADPSSLRLSQGRGRVLWKKGRRIPWWTP